MTFRFSYPIEKGECGMCPFFRDHDGDYYECIMDGSHTQLEIEPCLCPLEELEPSDLSRNNAVSLGKETMLLQTMEECAELIQAISKYNRTRGLGQPTETPQEEVFDNLLEELADVSICVEQLIFLLKAKVEVEYLKGLALERVGRRLGTVQEEEKS